jgi:nucleotide-binding universal stress UspA family protein
MFTRKIIGAVDASVEGAWAGSLAWQIASKAGASCELLNVSNDVSAVPATIEPNVDLDALMEHITAAARVDLEKALAGNVPPEAIANLEILMGRAAWMLPRAAKQREADLLVLGGRHHIALKRWFGGSVAHHVVRTADCPVLIAIPATHAIERVLVAVDLSAATGPTITAARDFANLFGAELRVVHAIEPLPTTFPVNVPPPVTYRGQVEEQFRATLDRLSEGSHLDGVMRDGAVERVLADEVEAWGADVVVVGSHGKGLLDRFLLGSTTHRLINALPASLLVVPVANAIEQAWAEEREQSNKSEKVLT